MLDIEQLEKKLNENITIEYQDQISSTNTVLLERIKSEDLSEGYTIIANAQTAGVGRYGRRFCSPEDTGVYMSVLLKPTSISQETINMITVAAAVATANAIESVSEKEAKIKWVNDIFIEERKVAGILAQGKVNNQTGLIEQIVLGVGVNLYKPTKGFHQEIKDTAGYVLNDSISADRLKYDKESKLRELPQYEEHKAEKLNSIKEIYISTLLNTFFKYYKRLEQKEYLDEYISRSMLPGKTVEVVQVGHKKTARVLEINSDCNLVVEYINDGGKEVLTCGEVSLKL